MRTSHVAFVFAFSLLSCTAGDSSIGDDPDDPGVDPSDDSTAGFGLSAADKAEGGEGDSLYARVCASGTTTVGIDVSYHNDPINWTKVAAAGVKFAFVRVSDGIGFHDPKFATYWAAAKAQGIIRGPYQFFRPSQNVDAQADLMVSAIGGSYTPGDLPPVIDVEATGNLSPATVAARVRQWVDRVKAKLGVDPIVYTGKYFWRDQVGGPTSFAGNPLWIAQYTTLCPDLPSPWTRWTFWQHSDHGSVNGVSGDVDVDKFNGSIDDLVELANGTTTNPPPPTTCNSATLGKTVAPRTCVQAASDSVWYQCDGKQWATPVNTSTHTGPAGTCSANHPL